MKDKRYATVKILIDTGNVISLEDIFYVLPKSVVAKDFGTNYVRFSRLIENPAQFRIKEVITLAKVLDIDVMKMVALVISQYDKKNAKGK
jgi:hypothetical protein